MKIVDETVKNLKSAKKSAYKALMDYFKDKKQFKKKFQEVKNLFKNGGVNGFGVKFKVDFSLLGNMEIMYRSGKMVRVDENGRTESYIPPNNVLKLSLFAELEFKPSLTYQHYIPIPVGFIPVFIKIEGQIGVKAEASLIDEMQPRSLSETLKLIELTLKLGARLDFGLGVEGVASVGGYGKVSFYWNFLPSEKRKWQWQWGAGIKLQLLMFEIEFGYESDKLNFGRSTALLRQRAAVANNSISEYELFDRLYDGSQPQLLCLPDGKQLLTWIGDDETRDDYNRAVLMYSVFDGEWSAPKSVFQNGTNDYAYDICEKNGEIYIAVQKAKTQVTESDDIASALSAVEIFTAKYNAEADCFTQVQQATNNSVYESVPQFATSENEIALLWQSNSENNRIGGSGANTIY